ncbi:hypothetical protein LTR95_012864 [Oleoguttula sp. CCFEE 5521]
MASLSGAGRLKDDVDYSRSHRSPPAVPSIAYNAVTSEQAPEIGDRPLGQTLRSRLDTEQQYQDIARTKSRGGESELQHPARKHSLSGLLRRQPSGSAVSVHSRAGSEVPTSPPLPANTTFLQYNANTTLGDPQRHTPQDSISTTSERSGLFRTKSKDSVGKERNMLRKSSKVRQQQAAELERQAREAQLLPRQPPRLPSHNPLPNLSSFDEGRPDSVAIFSSQAYTDPRAPPSVPQQSHYNNTSTANFSRPGGNAFAMAKSTSFEQNSSSSPAYAVRGASASHSASPPSFNALPGSVNGENGETGGASMTNRGRYSYASTVAGNGGHVNSPRRVRRRKDPTPFNILVIGTKSSGKTSFISFLRHSLALPSHKPQEAPFSPPPQGSFTSHYLEADMEGERIGLTLWDSPGLETNIVDLQLRETTAFIEAKFEDTFKEEQKVQRSPGFKDTHIHCVFYVLDPIRLDATVTAAGQKSSKGGLDEDVDLQTLRALWGKTTVIPVIAKADTLTTGHMASLKRAVWESIKTAKLSPLEALELEEDDIDSGRESDNDDEDSDVPTHDTDAHESVTNNLLDRSSSEDSIPLPTKRTSHARQPSGSAALNDEEPYIPLSILSPDPYVLSKSPSPSQQDLVRTFPWGTASPFNPQHCDFLRLRDSIFLEWRSDLRELSRVRWYEAWRTARLRNVPGSKMRIKGGVTPVGAVPREGRGASGGFKGEGRVPRSVSSQGQSCIMGVGQTSFGGGGVPQSAGAAAY